MNKLQKLGKFSFECCKIPINSKFNVDYMRMMLRDYENKPVCDILLYGFPIGFDIRVLIFYCILILWE